MKELKTVNPLYNSGNKIGKIDTTLGGPFMELLPNNSMTIVLKVNGKTFTKGQTFNHNRTDALTAFEVLSSVITNSIKDSELNMFGETK